MTDDKMLARAREFWRWFRESPHTETYDADCDRQLAALLTAVRDEALEEATKADEHVYIRKPKPRKRKKEKP